MSMIAVKWMLMIKAVFLTRFTLNTAARRSTPALVIWFPERLNIVSVYVARHLEIYAEQE